MNGLVIFTMGDPAHGRELWKSDGTAAGTVLVRDIRPGPAGSDPQWLTNVDGALFFSADDGTTGRELWKSDGTGAGTVLVKDIDGLSSFPDRLLAASGLLFFRAFNAVIGAAVLWRSDGTPGGTIPLAEVSPNLLTDVGGPVFFAGTADLDEELWKSDGTPAGTVRVKDIRPGPASSVPRWLTAVNGTLFFSAHDDTTGTELWKSDGTEAGTVLVKDITPLSGFPEVLRNVDGMLFFRAFTLLLRLRRGVPGRRPRRRLEPPVSRRILWSANPVVRRTHR